MKRGLAIMMTLLFAGLTAGLPAGAARAAGYEDYRQRQQDLAALAGVFGDLHHIRRQCEPRAEADVWRERMKTLIDLEAPLPDARQAMITAFNRAYGAARRRYPVCNRRARDYAAAQSERAEIIVARLVRPLHETLDRDEAALFTVSPETGAQPAPTEKPGRQNR